MQKQKTLDGEVIEITYHIPFESRFRPNYSIHHPKKTETKYLTDYGIEV